MGAEPWSYFVPYREDIESALSDLKRREFEAGRYNMGFSGPAATIEEAFERAGATGTQSILDMIGVADELTGMDSPEGPNLCHVAPLSRAQLLALFGTERPTHEMVRKNHDYYDLIDRGMGLYIVVYQDDRPAELFFAGYSFD